MTSNENLCQKKITDNASAFANEVRFLNKGEEDEMEIEGYEPSLFGTIVTWIFIILSLGSLRLVFHWYKHWMLYSTHRKCPLKFAQAVLVIDRYQECYTTYFVKKVHRKSLEKLSPEDVRVVSNDLDNNTITKLTNDTGSLVRIYFNDGSFIDESELIVISVKKLKYVWRDDKKEFCKLGGIEKCLNKSELHNMTGYSYQNQLLRRLVYGTNEIQIKVQSIGVLMLLEFLNPFYIFQVFSLILWFVELYLYYSFAIIAMSLFGIISSAVQTKENQKQLHSTVKSHGTITVCRNLGKHRNEEIYEEIPISDLVPGDIILIPRSGFIVPCDAVLLCGNCIVNESMLTGESVPVTKTALPCVPTPYSEREDQNHTLYCGTQVVQARYYADENIHAVVLRTGYLTAKGGLVRSILYPIPHDFKFDRDIYKFVWALGVIAVIGSSFSFYVKIRNKASLFDTIMDSLDIITIVVPPALPAAMTVGKYYAQNRLQKQKISCMNPSVINVSGSINCICFDKTGTLTEDGLDLYGVVPVENRELKELVTDVQHANLPNFKDGMASCHSLTLIDNVISGDPLDVKMFESTGWMLDETELSDTFKYDLLAPTIVKSPSEGREIGIIHQFQFSSHLQRMSVITKTLFSKDFTVYCKGSPEMIKSLSEENSLPKNLDEVLEKQTEKGYRVIAIGYKTMPATDIIKLKRLHRDEVECNLTFAGLIIFENKLKSQTIPTISDLKQAKMKIVMLTGDNIQTAICVAKECGIIDKSEVVANLNVIKNNGLNYPKLTYSLSGADSTKFQVIPNWRKSSISNLEMGLRVQNNCKYVMTGQIWNAIREHFPTSIPSILANGVVFARMSSDHKQQVIQELQTMGFYVAMCGDGANDCGALKTAHVGISLSEAESSVASPFTSQQADISCVPKVIREGRAALVTAFGLFKFMILYSLLEFFSTVLLYSEKSALSDFEFLYIDVFLIVVFAFFFGQTKPYHGRLVPQAPSSSLISVVPITSLVLQTGFMVFIQVAAGTLVKQFPWYTAYHHSEYANYENYAVYTVSQFQYIILAITFSFGKPYREPIHKNTGLFLSLVVMTLVSCVITVAPPVFIQKLFDLLIPPTNDFRYIIILLAVINMIGSLLFESVFVNYILTKVKHYYDKRNSEFSEEKTYKEVYRSIEHLSEIGTKYYGTMDSYNFI